MDAEKLFQEIPSRTIQGKRKNEGLSIVDNRPSAALQAKMIETMQRQEDDDELLQGKFVAQMDEEDDELLQGKMVGQLQEDDDELLQGKFDPIQRQAENHTGMPDQVKSQMEKSFDTDFSSVRVVPDSSKASDVGALAFTQGNSVEFAPGQFKPDTTAGLELIGHELTHVVQQSRGEVQPTTQINGMDVNDDVSKETEADVKGAKAAAGMFVG